MKSPRKLVKARVSSWVGRDADATHYSIMLDFGNYIVEAEGAFTNLGRALGFRIWLLPDDGGPWEIEFSGSHAGPALETWRRLHPDIPAHEAEGNWEHITFVPPVAPLDGG